VAHLVLTTAALSTKEFPVRVSRVVSATAAALVGCAVWSVVPALTPSAAAADEKGKGPDPAALERTREQVKMLDDLYKTAVVGINDTYVKQQYEIPAAMVAAKVFEAMKKKGYHDARLMDVTGDPKNKANAAKTAFEKDAVKQILDGKAYYEEVAEKDGKPVLRVATAVPAVNKMCAGCHGVKVGDKLGAIVYEVPIK
jgi:hypothetical protein